MKTRRKFIALAGLLGLSKVLDRKTSAVWAKVKLCLPTSHDVLGPFYVSGSPSRIKIYEDIEIGQRLLVQGKVYGTDCLTPLQSATVEVWQANAAGVYDTTKAYKLRGQAKTDADGSYTFETIYPGSYDGRPAHIHYRISAAAYTTLVTQLYFEGDPLIPTDPFASLPSAQERIVPVNKSKPNWQAQFDIYMNEIGVGTEDSQEQEGYLAVVSQHPFVEEVKLSYSNYSKGKLSIDVFDLKGIKIRTIFKAEDSAPSRNTIVWDGRDDNGSAVTSQTFVAVLQLNSKTIGKIKLVKK